MTLGRDVNGVQLSTSGYTLRAVIGLRHQSMPSYGMHSFSGHKGESLPIRKVSVVIIPQAKATTPLSLDSHPLCP